MLELVAVTDEPVLQAARRSSEQLFHRGLHLRFELWMVTKDVKRGLRILRRQLPPGLVIWDGLEGERPIERRGEPRDLVRRSERFGAAEPIGVSGRVLAD